MKKIEVLIQKYRLRQVAKYTNFLLTAALLCYVGIFFHRLISKIDSHSITIDWLYFLGSIVLLICAYLTLSVNWFYSCRLIDENAGKHQLLAFFASQPYKYLPSSIFTFSYRSIYSQKLGLPFKKSALAQLYENPIILLSNFILFLFIRVVTYKIYYEVMMLIILMFVCGFIIYKKRFIYRYNKCKLEFRLYYFFEMLLLSGLGWILLGLSLFFLSFSLGRKVDITQVMQANLLAYLLSILAVFAPGGIGIKEFVYTLYSLTGVVIVAWRLLTFICDLLLGGIAILIISNKKRKNIHFLES